MDPLISKLREHLSTRVDRSHNGPWMSCMSRDGRVMYVNRNVPTTARIGNKTVKVDDILLSHEVPEWHEIRRLLAGRKPNLSERKAIYLKAHATMGVPSERAHAKKIGVDWAEWSAWCRGIESKLEHGPFRNEPQDADVKPIPHTHNDLAVVA